MGNTGGTGKGSLWARGREDGLWSTGRSAGWAQGCGAKADTRKTGKETREPQQILLFWFPFQIPLLIKKIGQDLAALPGQSQITMHLLWLPQCWDYRWVPFLV